ncbi:hypothetical protein LOC71_16100 [Rhodopirellula sp. JC740]|uniref:Secreted protein n=1 Tax=Rhodopirellula halodulae TaxID=2894198 RepID=A0ABS8NK81_9BACT|nr:MULTISPECIES: hypothetical protein [unclassified Rhodopirellula]MCC9643809.1 hypothetical protein [Rhodopirellula sp. JC740]MCC9656973.1 hypothetical protein [Rhodopirellula sp. JC737]
MKLTKVFLALCVAVGSVSVIGCAPDNSTTQIEPAAEFSYDDNAYEEEMDASTEAQQQ